MKVYVLAKFVHLYCTYAYFEQSIACLLKAQAMADCMRIYFPYIGGEDLGKSKGGELKMKKIQG